MLNSTKIKIWYGLMAFMAISVVLALVLIYNNAYNVKYSDKVYEYSEVVSNIENKKNDWMNIFSRKSSADFILPATEVNIQLDKIDGYQKHRKVYDIYLSSVDDYKFFCAKQVIETYNRPYSYFRRGEELRVSILLESSELISSIKDELITYGIDIR